MGFAQEMKDFVGAYQATYDTGIKGRAQRTSEKALEYQKQNQDANLDIAKQELALKKQQVANSAALKGYVSPKDKAAIALAEANVARAQSETKYYDARTNVLNSGIATANANTAGLGLGDDFGGDYSMGTTTAGNATGDATGDDFSALSGQGSPKFAKGGMVQYAAEGAPVASAFSNKYGALPQAIPTATATPAPATPAPAGAIPTATPAVTPEVTPAATAIPKPDAPRPSPQATKVILDNGKTALNAGVKEFLYDVKKGSTEPGFNDQIKPIPLDLYTGFSNELDPEGKIPASLKSAVALTQIYQTADNPEAKFKAVVGALKAQQSIQQTLGGLIPHALEAGDVNAVCKLANDACDHFPFGHEIRFSPVKGGYGFVHKDENGKVIDQGTITPAQMLQGAMKLNDGSAYTDEMLGYYNKFKATGGSATKALELITNAAQSVAQAKADFKAIQDDPNATQDQIDSARATLEKASQALPTTFQGFKDIATQGKKPMTAVQIQSAINAAVGAVDSDTIAGKGLPKKDYTPPEEAIAGVKGLTTATKAFGKGVTKLNQLYTYDPTDPTPPEDPEAYLKAYKATMEAQKAMGAAEDSATKLLTGSDWGGTSKAERSRAVVSQINEAKNTGFKDYESLDLPELPDAKGTDPSKLVPDMVYMVNGTPMIWRVTDNGSGFQK